MNFVMLYLAMCVLVAGGFAVTNFIDFTGNSSVVKFVLLIILWPVFFVIIIATLLFIMISHKIKVRKYNK
jgi:hypothetical protein